MHNALVKAGIAVVVRVLLVVHRVLRVEIGLKMILVGIRIGQIKHRNTVFCFIGVHHLLCRAGACMGDVGVP